MASIHALADSLPARELFSVVPPEPDFQGATDAAFRRNRSASPGAADASTATAADVPAVPSHDPWSF